VSTGGWNGSERAARSDQTDGAGGLLPAGLIDVLPPHAAFEAATVERLLAAFAGFGYDRVRPPLIEFEDTLLAGSGAALATDTFRLLDPVSQRPLALRPDITMQVARIAATRLAHWPRPLRLSYAGQVIRVRGSQLRPERQLGQVGAELIGSIAPAADVEVVVMAVEALQVVGVDQLSVDLGLPTLVPAVIGDRPMTRGQRAELRQALDRKDVTAVQRLAAPFGAELARLLARLVTLSGPAEPALATLQALPLPAAAAGERADLAAVHAGLRAAAPDLTLTVDAVEARGFEYHQGVTFSLFARSVAGELGRGGRYRTEAGEPATGITLVMDAVTAAVPPPPPQPKLLLPAGSPPQVSRRLRAEGWRVVAALAAVADAAAEARRLGCSHLLRDGGIVPLPAAAVSDIPE
jgi:ATP phosphoribosyltransferase regulatory subunit